MFSDPGAWGPLCGLGLECRMSPGTKPQSNLLVAFGMARKRRRHGSARKRSHRGRPPGRSSPREEHAPGTGLTGLEGLEALHEAWLGQESKRSTGGSLALAGFRYQFQVTLLESTREWLGQTDEERRRPQTFAEILGDVVVASRDNSIVVHEVKRRLSRPNVRKAIEQFAAIDEVARKKFPSVAKILSFRLVCGIGEQERAEQLLARVLVEARYTRSPLRGKVTVVYEPNPEYELLGLLAQQVRAADPWGVYTRCLEELVLAAGHGDGFRAAATRIWGTLTAAACGEDPPAGLLVWSASDRPPEQTLAGPVLTGAQPSVRDLVKGSFAPRAEETGGRAERFAQWHSRGGGASKLRVFWIPGRSGSGKSIALLQLLARLHGIGWEHILYLGRYPELLSHAGAWARRSGVRPSPALIAADDPYPLGQRAEAEAAWRGLLRQFEDLRQRGGGDVLPCIVVCAGPAEQADALQTSFQDAIEVELDAPPKEDEEAVNRLRTWFEKRRGWSPRVRKAGSWLALELMLEWQTGFSIPEFAVRYRKGLEDSGEAGLAEFVPRLLVLNRLGIGYPSAAVAERLSPVQRDRLRRVQDDMHITAPEEALSHGIWFKHSHIGRAVYDEWFPPQAYPAERLEHFRLASQDCLEFADTPWEKISPIAALARDAIAENEPLTGFSDHESRELAEQLYRHAVRTDGIPTRHLAAWLRLKLAGARLSYPDPIEEALSRLTPQNITEFGMGAATLALLRNFEGLGAAARSDLLNLVERVLASEMDWSDWPAVATAAMESSRDARLPGHVLTWIDRHPRTRAAGWTLKAAVEQYPDHTRLIEAARSLHQDPDHPGWSYAWGVLWDRAPSEDLALSASRWLQSARTADASWGHVWRPLWEKDLRDAAGSRKDLIAFALSFMKGAAHSHGGWALVWTSLWERRETVHGDTPELESTLRGLGEQWLVAAPPSHTGWGFVWKALWEAGDRTDLARIAEDWLSTAPATNEAWGYVFPQVMNFRANDHLTWLGIRWLREAPPGGAGWGYIFPALWAHASETDRPPLRSAGETWLATAPDNHPDRGYVFEQLLRDRPSHGLRETAHRWLTRVDPSHGAWSRVWHAVVGDEPSDPQRRMALDWLESPTLDHPGWGWVWTALWRSRPDELTSPDETAELRTLARAQLERAPDESGLWGALFPALHLEDPDEQLFARARSWVLRMPPGVSGWDRVWEAVFRISPSVQLRQMGFGWLSAAGSTALGWPFVWRALAADQKTASEAREELMSALEQYAHEAPASARGFRELASTIRESTDVACDAAVASKLETVDRLPEGVWTQDRDIVGDPATLLDINSFPSSDDPVDHIRWKNAWLEWWKDSHSGPLFNLGLAWVAQAPGNSGRSYVLEELWDIEWQRDLVYPEMLRYLREAPPTQRRWPWVWRKAWRHKPSDSLDELRESALRMSPGDTRIAELLGTPSDDRGAA